MIPQEVTLKTPPQTVAYQFEWRVQIGQAMLAYAIPVSMTLVRRQPTPPGCRWAALYKFHAPDGPIYSTQGDLPIQFTDAGQEFTEAMKLVDPKK